MVETYYENQKKDMESGYVTSVKGMLDYLGSKELEDATSAKVELRMDGQQIHIEFTRHTNPDGTLGGFVSKEAQVSSSYISRNAVICGKMEVTDSEIGDGSAVVFFGTNKDSDDVITGTLIGKDVTIQAKGTKSFLTIRDSKIDDGVKFDLGLGGANICRSMVGSNVITQIIVPDPLMLTFLNIQQSDIKSGSVIILDKEPPRLSMNNVKFPAGSEVRMDTKGYGERVEQGLNLQNDTYTIAVPDLDNDPVLLKYIDDGETFSDSHRLADKALDKLVAAIGKAAADKVERVALLSQYVYDTISYSKDVADMSANKNSIPLDYFINNRGGVCFEHALLLYEILESERMAGLSDIKPKFVCGVANSSNSTSLHAWVEVEVDGVTYVIDPTTPLPYAIAGKRGDDNKFIRVFGYIGRDYFYEAQPSITQGKA
jgi:hypothetical protein